jgi:signal-transduction protein with cAMP-binding, CBS, and nucleotidyltransferase domain
MPIQAPPSRTDGAISSTQTVRSILHGLGAGVRDWSISSEASALDAIEQMEMNNIGALVVLSAQKLDGIVTQDDYTREITLHRNDSRETKVSEIMTRGVYYVTPETSIDHCMFMMTSKRIRHLPILEGDKVIGMLSIDDVRDRVTASES